MRILNRLLSYIDLTNIWVAKLISPIIIIITFIIGWEVFVRKAFNMPTIWAHELSYMLFGAFFMLAGGYILLNESHVRVEIITEKFPPKTRIIVDLVLSALFFFYCGVLLYTSSILGWESFMRREYTSSAWAAPRWPMLVAIPIGAFLIFMQGLARFIRQLVSLFQGGTK